MEITEKNIINLECNIDDMSSEELAFAMQQLLAGGAIDVFTTPIVMKKGRPAFLLNVMTTEKDREQMLGLIFRYTSTIGIRELVYERHLLERRELQLETSYGSVRRKDVCGYGVERSKYEYEDLARIAAAEGVSIEAARQLVEEDLKK